MKLIVGNLKMNLNYYEIKEYIDYFKDKNYSNVFFAPSSIYLSSFVDNGLITVAQDVGFDIKGAFTGDVSASQLKSIGVNYSIVGHSERRKYYNDSLYINRKIKCLLEQEITPILCIGESLEARNNNTYKDFLKQEIDEAFYNLSLENLTNVIIAYEPIWSIGTGVIPTNGQITETVSLIKEHLKDKYGLNNKILYGGSVNNSCILTLEDIIIIDGYLVGGCSTKKEDFEKLIEQVK